MILQVLAHRQVDAGLDPHFGQMRGRADAGEHQELRRIECAAGDDDIAIGLGADCVAAVEDIFDAGGAGALHQHLGRMRAGGNGEIGAVAGRPQIGARRRRTPSVADGVLAAADAFLRFAVVVLGRGQAERLAGVQPGIEQRIGGLGELRAERPRAAAIGILATLPGFGAPEIRQHVGVGPAARAFLRPAVVVAAIAARVSHHVDRRRAAQHLAAHRFDVTAVQVGLGVGLVAPVEHAVVVHAPHAERDRDVGMAIPRPGFQQQHARCAIFAQPVGEHAAGGARADDDVVVAFRSHCFPRPHLNLRPSCPA